MDRFLQSKRDTAKLHQRDCKGACSVGESAEVMMGKRVAGVAFQGERGTRKDKLVFYPKKDTGNFRPASYNIPTPSHS